MITMDELIDALTPLGKKWVEIGHDTNLEDDIDVLILINSLDIADGNGVEGAASARDTIAHGRYPDTWQEQIDVLRRARDEQ